MQKHQDLKQLRQLGKNNNSSARCRSLLKLCLLVAVGVIVYSTVENHLRLNSAEDMKLKNSIDVKHVKLENSVDVKLDHPAEMKLEDSVEETNPDYSAEEVKLEDSVETQLKDSAEDSNLENSTEVTLEDSMEAKLESSADEVKLEDSEDAQDKCTEENKTPKVALMFLSAGAMHNEPVWRAFFEAAGRLCLLHERPTRLSRTANSLKIQQESAFRDRTTERDPVQSDHQRDQEHQRINCWDERRMIEEEADRLMSRDSNVTDLIDRQTLFSVYINTLAYDNFEEPSIFAGSVIEDPVDVGGRYVNFLPVLATLKMLEKALTEPRNQKFVLLSESCIPIHPPALIHAQLISESQSRLNACWEGDHDLIRWNPELAFPWEWRKSYQFFALTRDHAQIAIDDIELQSNFNEYCFMEITNTFFSNCIPSEHFFPTLIAHHGLEDQTDCVGYVISEQWEGSTDPWGPVSYEAWDINSDLLRRLADRGVDEECDGYRARVTSTAIYSGFTSAGCTRRNFESEEAPNNSHWMVQQGYHPLTKSCPLFARKFSADVIRETLKSTLSCEGTGLGYWCY